MIKNLNKLFEKRIRFLLLNLLFCFPFFNFIILNSNQIQFISVLFYKFFLISFLFFLISLFILFYFFKDKEFGFTIFFCLLFIWNVGFYYLDLKKNLFFFINDKYDGVITLILIFFISLFLSKILKKEFINRLILIFLVINLSFNFYNNSSKSSLKKIDIGKISNNSKNNFVKKKTTSEINEKPNIFYIIPDALGSIHNLQEYKIKTKLIEDYLKRYGYKLAYNSKSSYSETRLTISSIFYLDYIVDGVTKFDDNSFDYYPYFNKNQKIPLANILEKLGYNFFRIENNYARCVEHIKIFCLNTTDKNFINLIMNDYSIEVFFSNSFIFPKIRSEINKGTNNPLVVDGYDTIQQYKKIFSNSDEILKLGGNFTLIHHMSPHRPMRDENCKILNRKERMNFSISNYQTSVKCVFNRIKEINELILSKYPNSIIIFQGDHGPTFENDKNPGKRNNLNIKHIKNRVNIFNAMLIPEKCKKEFYDEIGSVETIRLVLNCIGAKEIYPRKKSKSFMFFPMEEPKIYNIEVLGII